MASQTKGKKISLGRARRAVEDDIPEIESLLTDSIKRFFFYGADGDVKKLLKTCVLCVCQLDTEENVIGFIAITDHPRVPHVHPSAWEEYLWTRYKVIEMNVRNTLFVHLLCWSPCVNCREIAQSMLRSVFMHDLYVQFICMLKQHPHTMQLDPDDPSVETMFKHISPTQSIRGVSSSKLPCLMSLSRSDVAPRLKIRRAVEEDNDDIVPIVELQSKRLRELYGEFYISELVSRHPESNRVLLVCEYNEQAVGIMILNTQINYEILQYNFDLSPYNGLLSCTDTVDTATPLRDTYNDSSTQIGEQVGLQDESVCNMNYREKEGPKVSFGEVSLEMPRSDSPVSLQGDVTIGWRYLSLLEEEDLDFDIINIDGQLLSVPHVLSSQSYFGFQSDMSFPEIEEVDSLSKLTQNIASDRKSPRNSYRRRLTEYNLGLGYKKYAGKPDAFIIELFAMHPDIDERHGFDILEVTFEMFPDFNYCVLALPTGHIPYPLLEHFTLVTPFIYRTNMVDQSLYVAHRNSIRGKVSLRPAEAFDQLEVERILKYSPRKSALMERYMESLTSRYDLTYMLLSEKKPIGLIMLGPLRDEEIRSRYAVSEGDISEGLLSGMVTEAVLAPALDPHSRWFMRELLRHTEYDELFWSCSLAAGGDAMPGRNLISLTGRMVPTLPRKPIPDLTLKKVDTKINLSDYCVWHISRPLTSTPKVDVNHSIVVVGASDTGLSFIETLLFGPSSSYLTLTNVTLVSTHGLPVVRERSEFMRAAKKLIPRTGRFHSNYFKSVPLNFYIDVMEGTVVGIDRKNKCITMQDGGIKFYDDLYLTYGLQFQHPHHLHDEWKKEERLKQGMYCEHSAMDEADYTGDALPTPPFQLSNMIIVNDIIDAHRGLRMVNSILDMKHERGYTDRIVSTVVVYGACVEALCCIEALLDMGLAPGLITYIEPFPSDDNSVLRVQHFNNETVDSRVQCKLESSGVTCYRGYSLTGWTEHNDGYIVSLKLLSRHHFFELNCLALFYYGEKSIDLYAFAVMNSSGLVYDGGLVVDPQLYTNDPHIVAAGPATKYSRQLHAEPFQHKYYRSEDIGATLGKMVLDRLDPFRASQLQAGAKGDSSISKDTFARTSLNDQYPNFSTMALDSFQKFKTKSKFRSQTVLKFKSPLMVGCTLPGGLHYLHVMKPGPEVPAGVALSMDSKINGHTLTTDKDGNYFCLQLDEHHIIVEITCLSKLPFHEDLLTQLYGKHQQMFNNLLLRFEAGMIDDLYEYFISPWLTAFYRDDFAELLADIDTRDIILNTSKLGSIKDVIEKILSVSDCAWTINKRLSEIREFTEDELCAILVDWLKARKLPMYAISASD